jgi:hypothetical protein
MKRAKLIPMLILLALSMVLLGAKPIVKGKGGGSLPGINVLGDSRKMDVNRISTFIRNNGSFDRDPGTGNSGFEWPKGTGNTAIYASGLWLGGKRGTSVRVAVAEYEYEFDAGPIAPGVNPEDARYRVYSVNRADDASTNPDYAAWPVADGAPVDATGKPLILGDRTLFSVFNENNPDDILCL